MPIAISCIDCGFAALVKDHLAGRVVECPKCKAGLQVPMPAPAPAEVPSRDGSRRSTSTTANGAGADATPDRAPVDPMASPSPTIRQATPPAPAPAPASAGAADEQDDAIVLAEDDDPEAGDSWESADEDDTPAPVVTFEVGRGPGVAEDVAEAEDEARRALDRSYLGAFEPSRPLPLPADPPTAPADPKAAARELGRARTALVAARARYATAIEHRRETLDRRAEVRAAADLLGAGFSGLRADDFGLPLARLDEAEATLEELDAYLPRLDPYLESFEREVVCRLVAGLSLLEAEAVAARVPRASAWRAEARGLYPVGAHLAARVLPAIVPMAEARGTLERTLGLLEGNEESQPYLDGILRAAARLHGQLVAFDGRLGDAPRVPLPGGEDTVGLARFAMPPILPGPEDVMALIEASGEAIDRILGLHRRLVGRLSMAVEAVETALGLPPLESRVGTNR